MDFIYKKSGAIFNAHSYWTKQPIDTINYYINKYCPESGTVLDPFCGSGMTGVSAIKTKRKFILSDISPTCLHIAKGYTTKFKIDNIDTKLEQLLLCLDKYYKTLCPECGKENIIKFTILKDTLEEKNCLEIDRICYTCSCSKNKLFKYADEQDKILLESQDFLNYFYPQDNFFGQEPKRNYKRGIYKVFQLYSKRNITVLSILWNRITNLEDENFKTLCKFAFTSILYNCSLLSRYNPKYENTQIKMGTYYIPGLIKDNNVVDSFRRKITSILNANKEIFNEPDNICDGKIIFQDATKLEKIKTNSIDYIYTDPPYSDILNYAELNIVFESWLKEKTNSDLEMIVSKSENKSIENYQKMFASFMKNSYRVLKENSYITIIFNNANISHWKAFQCVLNDSDFEPIITSTPERLISNSKTSSQLSTKKKSQCFLAFTLKKNKTYKKSKLKKLSPEKYASLISNLTEEAKLNGYLTPSDIYDYIINSIMFKYEINESIVF